MNDTRLRYLFELYVKSAATVSEENELLELIADPANKSIANQLIDSFIENKEPGRKIDKGTASDILYAIFSSDKPETGIVHRVHFLRRGFLKYAAAIIIVFGIGAYLWNNNSKLKTENVKITKTNTLENILPGGQRALLTLADGSTIELDSAANGQLAIQQGSSVIKKDGQIIYNSLNSLNPRSSETASNTMTTPKGGKYQLLLPDGSKVWLNSASTVRYPTYFGGNERKIFISGEIYIEVAKNKSKPFIVDIKGKSTVEVLGTQFNINSYDEEGDIKTTLIEGGIKVNNATNSFLLQPGQQLNGMRIIDHPNVEQVIAWKNGFFNFDNSNIQTAMRQIARWYNIEVVYEGRPPADVLMGELPMNASIEQVYKILGNIGVRFRVEGNKIIIAK